MKNLLKAEFYKSNKGVLQYVVMVTTILMMLTLILTSDIMNDFVAEIDWIAFERDLPFSLAFSLFVPLFVMIYITTEFSQGTIKNYIAIGFSRTKILLAKYIKVLVITFACLFVAQIFSLCIAPFVLPNLGTSFWPAFAFYAYSLLALIELVTFFVAISFIIRGLGGMIAIWIGISFVSEIIKSLNYLFDEKNLIFKVLTEFIQYSSFEYQFETASLIVYGSPSPYQVILAIVMPIIVSGVSLCAGLIIFNKSDVK